MSEFDDPILRDRLSRSAGAPPDNDAAYLSVQQRVRHVKRRRVAIWGGAAALVIGVGAVSALQGPDGAKVTVPPTASTPVASTVVTATSTTATSTTATSTTATSTTATSTTAATTTAVSTTSVASTQPAPAEITNPETALGNPDPDNAGAPPTRSATASRPTAPPAAGDDDASRNGVGDDGRDEDRDDDRDDDRDNDDRDNDDDDDRDNDRRDREDDGPDGSRDRPRRGDTDGTDD